MSEEVKSKTALDIVRVLKREFQNSSADGERCERDAQLRVMGRLNAYEVAIREAGMIDRTTFVRFAGWLFYLAASDTSLELCRNAEPETVRADGRVNWPMQDRLRFTIVKREHNRSFVIFDGEREELETHIAAERLFLFFRGEGT